MSEIKKNAGVDRIQETFNALKWADREIQEQACKSIDLEFAGAGKKLAELFRAEADRMKAAFFVPKTQPTMAIGAQGKPKEEPERPPEEEEKKAAVKPPVVGTATGFVRRIGGPYRGPSDAEIAENIRKAEMEKAAARAARRAALKVVEQRKPEPEPEPEPEAEAEPQQGKGVVTVAPVLARAAGWDQAAVAMNRQHAIIENVGGKAVICCWEPSTIDPTRLVVVFQNKESFLLRYSNRFVSLDIHDGKGGTVRMPLAQWWLSHRDREQYRGVTFRPGSSKVVGGDFLNLWQGWGVEARAGDWRLIRSHIRMIIAGGNREFWDYVERWIAWAVQNPAAQAEVALVLIGLKGAGKGTLIRCLQRIFGAHAFQVTSREEVIGKFNGHLQDCVLFIADEAYWGGDKRCVGRLQGMITEPTLPIERKGIDLIQVPNFLHVVMLAEPGWVIPAGRYERRYAALTVSPVRRGDRNYFRALHKEIAEGGAEAMFYDLQRMQLGDWHPRDIPEALLSNEALQKQQGYTLPPLEQWYVMLLHEGTLPGALSKRPNHAFTRSLLDDARERIPRLKWDLSEVALWNFLTDEDTIGIPCTKFRANFANGWSFPPLSDLRAAWCRRYGPVKWDNPDAKEWGKN